MTLSASLQPNNHREDSVENDDEGYDSTKIITRRPFEGTGGSVGGVELPNFSSHAELSSDDGGSIGSRSRRSGRSTRSSASRTSRTGRPRSNSHEGKINRARSPRQLKSATRGRRHRRRTPKGQRGERNQETKYGSSEEFLSDSGDEDDSELLGDDVSELYSRSFNADEDGNILDERDEEVESLVPDEEPDHTDGSLESATSIGTYDDGSSPSVTSGGSNVRGGDADSERISIAKREHKAIQCLRASVLVTLVLLAGALALGLALVSNRAQWENYEAEFDNLSQHVAAAWKDQLGQTIATIDALSVQVTSATHSMAQSVPFDRFDWPNVTIPDFHIRGASTRLGTGMGILNGNDGTDSGAVALSISLVPVVTSRQRRGYEYYVRQRNTWIEDAMEWDVATSASSSSSSSSSEPRAFNSNGRRRLKRRRQLLHQPPEDETARQTDDVQRSADGSDDEDDESLFLDVRTIDGGRTHEQIFAIQNQEPLPEPMWTSQNVGTTYFPIRQNSPVVPQFVNYNLLSNNYTQHSVRLYQTQQGQPSQRPTQLILGPLLLDNDDHDATVLTQMVPTPPNIEADKDINSAIGTLWYPTYESFQAEVSNRKLVGLLFVIISWPRLFSNTLPPDIDGLICVVTNSCNQAVTFRLNGPDVDILGNGDMYEQSDNGMANVYHLSSLLDLTEYTTLQIGLYDGEIDNQDQGICQDYTLKIYPSRDLQRQYVTKAPALIATVVGVVFLLAVILFILYDRVVERRQKLVYKSAMEARAIVSSLFPAVVRDRLFQTNRDKETAKKAKMQQNHQQNSLSRAMGRGRSTGSIDEDNNDGPDADKIAVPLLPRPDIMHDTIPESPTRTPSTAPKDSARSFPGAPTIAAGSSDGSIDALYSPASVARNMGSLAPPFSPTNGVGQGQPSSGSLLRAKTSGGGMQHPKHRLRNFLTQGSNSGSGSAPVTEGLAINDSGAPTQDDVDDLDLGKPIADLFPHTTVLFADIAGFTAWSSEREPEQVFTLLQTIYHAFDRIGKKRGVFKVETIGDCYVAVTGLPDPQADHAVRMTKFAKECLTRMNDVTKKLEVSLGPDTADLEMRVGLHSGPVTAGVLQGEKSRFQLFGDTVNMASRMESTGERNRIQISQSTADLLTEGGKSFWIRPREKRVNVKGKGDVQTYWISARTTGMTALVARKSDEGDSLFSAAGGRRAPPRTRSAFNDGGPKRGVQRATSDSLAKMATTSKVARQKSGPFVAASLRVPLGKGAVDKKEKTKKDLEKRKQRLVEWQVELFVKMLKKIVVARVESRSNHGTKPDGENKFDESITSDWETSYSESEFSETFATDDDLSLSPTRSPISTMSGTPNRFGDSEEGSKRVDMAGLVPIRQTSLRPPTRKSSNSGNDSSAKMPVRQSSFRSRGMVRQSSMEKPVSVSSMSMSMSSISEHDILSDDLLVPVVPPPKIVVDEVAEVIVLPKFSNHSTKALADADTIELSPAVLSQLHEFIQTIAGMYRTNPFHNFEHASHVTMSANKFLNRIVVPENVDYERESKAIASDLHDYTYGITSDPLTQFAILFSALIHDVDHQGIPNGQLAVEKPELAKMYRNQSVAEQNSVDLSWALLMEPRFKDLQACICSNSEERHRFRQLVVNSVMATDIFDKDMKSLRNKRWDKAFHRDQLDAAQEIEINFDQDTNMKATIVIEHIIQASDVAHTMQHWHIYTKWNERLFEELYAAYESGRSSKNPAEGWYKGELWFFDNYVIPLAKKLEECNVFGVASDECLNYARANRSEWCMKGEASVLDMVSRYEKRKFMLELGETMHSHDRKTLNAVQKKAAGGPA